MYSRFLAAGIYALLFFSTGCQRDDICPATTQTTPLLLISFFDAEEPDIPKTAPNLRVRATGYDTLYINRQSLTEIAIPLRTDSDFTEYDLMINAPVNIDDEGNQSSNANLDRIRFSYSREEQYVNRACSFRMIFTGLRARVQEDENLWIDDITIEEENIENETVTHIFIYH